MSKRVLVEREKMTKTSIAKRDQAKLLNAQNDKKNCLRLFWLKNLSNFCPIKFNSSLSK